MDFCLHHPTLKTHCIEVLLLLL